ncbi:M20 aminoacylase family protein [Hydrogenophaga sp.]|uniref:M20 aminoacylase family protein n=1 Tax=Hydrogenophaga sp. TaxID=1904254 RepID=UPI00272FF648|nr:M20 aminoacylase family protein [Hydrogenophaga sp.]MDP2017183.1 M20 aminoacylase family protein [Hydrogenophaga sp.]
MERLSDLAIQEFTALRRDIHQHPELAFDEHRTSALVAQKLQAWGYEVSTGLGGTGVVGQLRRGRSTRAIGLRADMDALPILEATGADWTSCHHGVMHACGHDGHTATLLAAAQHLATHGAFDGTLNLIFQPAEEGGGGAVKMMEDGLFERFPCDAIFAMHNMPGFAQGQLVFRSGPTMASSDYATLTLHGVGGHGAMPHKATDVVVAAASIVMALQTIVSRHVDPMQPAVVTVGALHAGQANNVIPASARLELSVRALDPQVRRSVEQRIRELVRLQAESFGVRAELDWRPGYAVLVNDAQQTARALAVAQAHFPSGQVVAQGPMLTGSEDFAFMLERVPGSYLFIGNGVGQEPGACMVHNPAYDFNDHNIAIGASYWIALVNELLSPTHP